jgi:hypothetical protein
LTLNRIDCSLLAVSAELTEFALRLLYLILISAGRAFDVYARSLGAVRSFGAFPGRIFLAVLAGPGPAEETRLAGQTLRLLGQPRPVAVSACGAFLL